MLKIANGARVNTPKGPGEVVGKEKLPGASFARYIVKLDDPKKWEFGQYSDKAYFFEKDVTPEKGAGETPILPQRLRYFTAAQVQALAYAQGLEISIYKTLNGLIAAVCDKDGDLWQNTTGLDVSAILTPHGESVFSPLLHALDEFASWYASFGRHHGSMLAVLHMLCFDEYKGVKTIKYSEEVARYHYCLNSLGG